MVEGALDREVERDLEAMLGCGVLQSSEVRERAQSRVKRIVAAFGAADRVGATGVVRARLQGVVAALAMRGADRMDRREIKDVEAHGAHGPKPANDVRKSAMLARPSGRRAGKEFVPGADAGLRPFDFDRNRGLTPDHKMTNGRAAHRV